MDFSEKILVQMTDPAILEMVQEMSSHGVGDYTIASNLGYPIDWWVRAKQEAPEIQQAIDTGKHIGIEAVAKSLYEEAIDRGGSVAAKKFYLKAVNPEKWVETKKVAIDAAVNLKVGPITEEDAEVVKGIFESITSDGP